MKKLLLCVTLLLLAQTYGAGQEAEAQADAAHGTLPSFVRRGDVEAEARRLLESGENRERAWGAYLAGLHGLKALAPQLAGLLADPTLDRGGWEAGLVRQAALDALIRLRAEVPAETLMPLLHSAPNEVLILLAREPQRNQQALLSLFNDRSPTQFWLAVGNLLAEMRAPGFAARLMAGLKIEANVHVYDRESSDGIGTGIGIGCGGLCGGEPPTEGFPPVSFYDLITGDTLGAVVVAPGRHTIYYLRSSLRGCPNGPGWEQREGHRVEYIAGLLGMTEEELKLETNLWREVVCQEERPCRRALAAVRDEVVGGYTGAVKRLLDAALLDPAEAVELKPDITLHFNDAREQRPFPLPSRLKGVKVEVYVPDAEPAPNPEEPPPDEPSSDAPR